MFMDRSIRYIVAAMLASHFAPSASAHDDEGFGLLVCGWNSGNVVRYDWVDGTIIDVPVSSGFGGLSNPHSIAIGPQGLGIYVASWGTSSVIAYDRDTGAVLDTVVVGVSQPADCKFGPDGMFYVSSHSGNFVNRYDPHGPAEGGFGPMGQFVGPGNGLNGAEMMAWDADGDFYLASGNNSRILKYDGTTGAFIENFVWNDPATPGDDTGGLSGPHDMTFGPDGDLYVTSFNSNPVFRYNGTTGDFVEIFVATGVGGPSLPHGLAFGPDGNLYVASWGTSNVKIYDGTSGAPLGDLFAPGFGGITSASFLIFEPEAFVTLLTGDMNCDGVISVGDIAGFVLALTDPAQYSAVFPECDIDAADVNNDGAVSVGDIGAFVALLTGGT